MHANALVSQQQVGEMVFAGHEVYYVGREAPLASWDMPRQIWLPRSDRLFKACEMAVQRRVVEKVKRRVEPSPLWKVWSP